MYIYIFTHIICICYVYIVYIFCICCINYVYNIMYIVYVCINHLFCLWSPRHIVTYVFKMFKQKSHGVPPSKADFGDSSHALTERGLDIGTAT